MLYAEGKYLKIQKKLKPLKSNSVRESRWWHVITVRLFLLNYQIFWFLKKTPKKIDLQFLLLYGKCTVVLLLRKVFGLTSLADVSLSFSPLGLILYVWKMQKKTVLLYSKCDTPFTLPVLSLNPDATRQVLPGLFCLILWPHPHQTPPSLEMFEHLSSACPCGHG